MSKRNYGAGKLLLALFTATTLSSVSYPAVSVSAEVAPKSTNFTDIKGHWAETSIKKAAELGLVEGYTDGTYKPSANVTRAEFAAMLSRATKYKPNKVSQAFSDVPSTNWAAEAVNKVTALGFVNRVDYPNGFVGNKAMTAPDASQYKNVNEAFGKSLKLRSDVATVTMSKMIFVDPYPADGKKSVYAPMFHSDADPVAKTLYQERYRIFTEYSFTSKRDNLSRLGTLADTGLSIQIGLPIFNSNIDKYGANYYTRDERSPKTYNKGQGEKDMWAAAYSTKSVDDGLAQMYTEEGKMINLRVNK